MTNAINPYDPTNIQQSSLFGEDDRAAEKEQRRSRETKRFAKKIVEQPPPLPDGPCCGRCNAWVEPTKATDCGTCRFLGITTKRLDVHIERGAVIDWNKARQFAGEDAWEELHTRAWFECSAFTQREEQEAA
jgi:hypothetical protein